MEEGHVQKGRLSRPFRGQVTFILSDICTVLFASKANVSGSLGSCRAPHWPVLFGSFFSAICKSRIEDGGLEEGQLRAQGLGLNASFSAVLLGAANIHIRQVALPAAAATLHPCPHAQNLTTIAASLFSSSSHIWLYYGLFGSAAFWATCIQRWNIN